MKSIILAIDGMTCSACSSGLEKYLNKQDGVVRANVNLVMNNASIEYDDKKLSLKEAILISNLNLSDPSLLNLLNIDSNYLKMGGLK